MSEHDDIGDAHVDRHIPRIGLALNQVVPDVLSADDLLKFFNIIHDHLPPLGYD